MTRAYRNVLIAVMISALLVAVLARRPHRSVTPSGSAAVAPSVRLALEVHDGAMTPDPAGVPKDHEVELSITNREASVVRVTLGGYEDRVDTGAIAPGVTWSGRFLADRPGQDFAWLIGGRPVGRLAVAGSHLEEGHR